MGTLHFQIKRISSHQNVPYISTAL